MLVACLQPAAAQTSRDQIEARALYRQANAKAASAVLRASLARQASGFFGDGSFQPGALRTFDGRYRPVPGLRFHAGLHVIEAQDSIDTDSTHLWPVGSLRGFDLGEAGGVGTAALRRFRPRLVKEGSAGTRRDFVEVLTAVDAGPLLLAWLYTSGADAAAGRLSFAPMLLVGPGNEPEEPLRPLDLNQAAVLRLFGKRADDMRTFADTQHLHFDQPAEVARIIDRYNRVAVVK
ncbi:hypothetical protein [Hymenobacter terricola]|uniref:hypothetical protein n=1 Tax=Hymenobacter terricola TaxID=2819236 RepID=UPI001B30B27A|nr:hypothetical protein [Hymenobacter terricola]